MAVSPNGPEPNNQGEGSRADPQSPSSGDIGRQVYAKLERILVSLPEALLVTDDHGRILLANPLAGELLGFPPDALQGQDFGVPQRESEPQEVDLARRDGCIRILEMRGQTILWDNEQVWLITFHDISERKRLEAELEHQARIDQLTGLHNRARFQVLLEHEMHRAQRYQSPMALIMFDLDYFKQVNDDHGHNAGDHVLRVIADTIAGQIRDSDILGRWGGEEFMLFLPETFLTGATELAERIRKEVARARFDTVDRVTVSLGVTELGYDDTLSAVVDRVDRALYRAKNGGRNRVERLPAPQDDADPG